MDSKDKDLLRSALKKQRDDERYNQALSKLVSEKMKSRSGYKKYLDLIDEVRKLSRERECSVEKAAKYLIDEE